jgi:hypothetical protein
VKVNLTGGGKEWFLYGKYHYKWAQDWHNLYRKWWKDRLITTIEDIEPASDAIARAAKSSWWSWDDGSHLFHWMAQTLPDGHTRWIKSLLPESTAWQQKVTMRYFRCGNQETGGQETGQSLQERIHCSWLCGIFDGIL